jgi:hypothetical protein
VSAGHTPESGRDSEHDFPELTRFDSLVTRRLGSRSARKYISSTQRGVTLRLFQNKDAQRAEEYGFLLVGNEQPLAPDSESPEAGPAHVHIIDGAPVVTALRLEGRWRICHQTARRLDAALFDNPEHFWQSWVPRVERRTLPLWQPEAKELADILEGSIPRIDMLGT